MSANDHHSKGEKDGKKGKYEPPHERNLLEELLFGYSKKEIADREAYRAGRRNARKQRRD